MRDCQPAPVDLKYSTTSRLYRTDRSNFGLADFGRPRSARSGTIDFSCLADSGGASGSALAASRILRSSAKDGTAILERLDGFDIMLDLTTRGSAQTDDPAPVTSFDERDVVKSVGPRCEGNHAQLVVAEAIIDPNKRSIPVEFPSQAQRNAVSGSV